MNEKEKEEIHSLQGQWAFVTLAAILAIFIGVAATALYDVLRHIWSTWTILLVFGALTVFLLDAFTYLFDNLHELRNDPNKTTRAVLRGYFKDRAKIFIFWK